VLKITAFCKAFDGLKEVLSFESNQGCSWVEGGTAALGSRVHGAGKINILNLKM
jgi:hypothetical protein